MPDCAPAICIDEDYTSIDKYPSKRRRWTTEGELPTAAEKEKHIEDIKGIADGQNVKTFVSEHWTLEYDLFYSGLQNEMLQALITIKYADQNRESKRNEINEEMKRYSSREESAAYFYSFFYSESVSKAEFAQTLASSLLTNYSGKPAELISKLPPYLVNAIRYVTEV
jgi:putative ATP-dependent endonuclease of OLD family